MRTTHTFRYSVKRSPEITRMFSNDLKNFRRRDFGWLMSVSALSMWPFSVAHAAPRELPIAKSLVDELSKALMSSKPLVVMVSLEGCPFCKIARENYLIPLMLEQSIPIVQVDMRKSVPLIDVQGKLTTHDAVTRAWQIKVAPTVLFLGKNGQEVAERLVGASIPDFYGSYLDDRVRQALLAVRQ